MANILLLCRDDSKRSFNENTYQNDFFHTEISHNEVFTFYIKLLYQDILLFTTSFKKRSGSLDSFKLIFMEMGTDRKHAQQNK